MGHGVLTEKGNEEMAYRRSYRRSGYNGGRYSRTSARSGYSRSGGRRGTARGSTRRVTGRGSAARELRIVVETHPTGAAQRPAASFFTSKMSPAKRRAKY